MVSGLSTTTSSAYTAPQLTAAQYRAIGPYGLSAAGAAWAGVAAVSCGSAKSLAEASPATVPWYERAWDDVTGYLWEATRPLAAGARAVVDGINTFIDRATPVVLDAAATVYEFVSPALEAAAEVVAPVVRDVVEWAAPIVEDVAAWAAPKIERIADALEPYVAPIAAAVASWPWQEILLVGSIALDAALTVAVCVGTLGGGCAPAVAGFVILTGLALNDYAAEQIGVNYVQEFLEMDDRQYATLEGVTIAATLLGPGAARAAGRAASAVGDAISGVSRAARSADAAAGAATATSRGATAAAKGAAGAADEAAVSAGKASQATSGAAEATNRVRSAFRQQVSESLGVKAGDDLAGPVKAGPGCSFAAATPILLADGTSIAISDLQVGDQVLSLDVATGEQTAQTVTAINPHSDDIVYLTLSDGTTVETTHEHPWWDPELRQFIRTDHLTPGETLLTAGGATLTVVAVEEAGASEAVWDITVNGTHTYYVGDTPTLVHNCPITAAPKTTQTTEAGLPAATGQPRDARGRFAPGAGGETAATAAGRNAHNEYFERLRQSGECNNCRIDQRIPGTLLRPDLVDLENRIVRDLKPNNPRAIARGNRQLAGYVEALNRAYPGTPWKSQLEVY